MLVFSSELAREKNLKNQKSKGGSIAETEANKGLSLQERQLRDAARYASVHVLIINKKHLIPILECARNNS